MARMDALSAGHGATDAALAATLQCRAATISTWKQNPDFIAWLAAEERRVLDHLWGCDSAEGGTARIAGLRGAPAAAGPGTG